MVRRHSALHRLTVHKESPVKDGFYSTRKNAKLLNFQTLLTCVQVPCRLVLVLRIRLMIMMRAGQKQISGGN